MLRDPVKKAGFSYPLPVSVGLALLFLFVILIPKSFAGISDCSAGYEFQRMSGVGCVQKNCALVPNAHYSYEGYCICGSAGSINENPNDPNKRCTLPHDNAACPDCVYACVHNNEDCPSQKPAGQQSTTQPSAQEQERIINALSQSPFGSPNKTKVVTAGISWEAITSIVKRGFGAIMAGTGWVLDKTTGYQIIQDKGNTDSGWAGMVVAPNGDYVNVKIFEGRLELSWEKGVAAEFNLISVKGRPGSHSFIDGFSIGIGPGAVNKDEGDHEIPGTPISPNINFGNIRDYFGEKWDSVKNWWHENAPWPLGGVNTPNIGGGQ